MTRTIENSFLKISVSDHGAELTGIYDKTNDREILWQADPAYWKRHAPVLFPNVGRNYKDIWRLNGKEYPSSQHGFARDSDFICTDITDTSLSFVLKSSEETLNVYPFAFALKITYTLKKHDLEVCWEVVNNDSETMYFTIGGHPAFRVPVREGESQSDYRLAFEGLDTLTYLLIDTSVGTVLADEPHTLSLENGTCSIAPHMFDKDALVFDNGQIQKAGILFPDGTPYLTQDGKDRESGPDQYIANMCDGALAGFKYFDLSETKEISVTIKGHAEGTLYVRTSENGEAIAEISISPSKELREFSSDIHVSGNKEALFFVFEGKGSFDFISFTLK